MDLPAAVGWVPTDTPGHIIAIRLALAALLGGLIGYERESHAAAGLRTHILIAAAAALFTILAFEIFAMVEARGTSQSDPIRVIEAVTAGIAFLGAGAIFQHRHTVSGLTTGAGMWLAGAVGVACALGYYAIAILVALFALIVLAALKRLARRIVGDGPKEPDPG